MALIEERVYVLHTQYGPKDYLDIYKAEGLKLQSQILGGLAGYFTTEVGELNAIVSLWRYESFEERQRRRILLAKEPQWLNYLDKVRPMIKSMNNRLLTSTDISPI